jgi:predicted nuclease of predicted toxin-antitoxin system
VRGAQLDRHRHPQQRASAVTDKEIEQASRALVRWCESQDLDPRDAVCVMVSTVAAILRTGDISAQDASRIVGETIRDIMEDRS